VKSGVEAVNRLFNGCRKAAPAIGLIKAHRYVAIGAAAVVVGLGGEFMPMYLLMLTDRELAARLHGHLLPRDLTRAACVMGMWLFYCLWSWGLNELERFPFGPRLLWRLRYGWRRGGADHHFL
jgi:hypothetical protein